jgi:hypothetical protein
MTHQVKHIRTSKKGKRFIAGSRLLGRGHSAEVHDTGRGRVLKKFTLHNPALARNQEFDKYVRLGLNRSPVIVPMVWTAQGLKMPKLRIVTRSALPHEFKAHGFIVVESPITDAQMKILYDGLRELGSWGIYTDDVLQVGIADNGKPYFFDVGGFSKEKPLDAEISNRAYWHTLCEKLGKDSFKELYPEWPTLNDLAKQLGD